MRTKIFNSDEVMGFIKTSVRQPLTDADFSDDPFDIVAKREEELGYPMHPRIEPIELIQKSKV